MKQVFFSMALAVALFSCGGSGTEKKADTTPPPPASMVDVPKTDTAAAVSPEFQKGHDLIAKNACLSCHKENEKLIGPAYKDVAGKYENTPSTIKMLSEKIIKGGKGVWGDVEMTPHPSLSKSDAEEMVKYVLSLKK